MMSFSPDEPRPLRILLAEDDEAMRSLLTLALARAGHAVVALEDGYELADYVSLTQVCGGPLLPPDLILSDIRMPGRTGLEVLAQVRSTGLTCPVILLSSFADEETREEARRLGVRAFLDKPVDLEVLKRVLQAAVYETAQAGVAS
jgi:CheY-like chemotaxis protein